MGAYLISVSDGYLSAGVLNRMQSTDKSEFSNYHIRVDDISLPHYNVAVNYGCGVYPVSVFELPFHNLNIASASSFGKCLYISSLDNSITSFLHTTKKGVMLPGDLMSTIIWPL